MVAAAANLEASHEYANAHGALTGLLCAERVRFDASRDVRLAAAEMREYQKREDLEPRAHEAHAAAMERLVEAASSKSRSALAGQLATHFAPVTAERLVLRFVRDVACNALQLELAELVFTEEAEDIDRDAGGGRA